MVGGHGARTTSGRATARNPVDFELQFSLLGDDGALFTSYRRSLPEPAEQLTAQEKSGLSARARLGCTRLGSPGIFG